MREQSLYFAYGSNLDAADWSVWCEEQGEETEPLVEVSPAWLVDWSMRFHYRSIRREGGAADVVPDGKGTAVPGVLFNLSPRGWALMDRKEGAPTHYERASVSVMTADGRSVTAITYVVAKEKRRSSLQTPTDAYAALIQGGLDNRNLSIQHLKSAIQKIDASSAIQYVFVYGTLMRGQSRWAQLKPWSSGPVRPGRVNGRLHHLGAYPGLRLEHDGIVHGELHRCECIEQALDELDRVEGWNARRPEDGLYARLPVAVDVGDGSVWAWTYVVNHLPSTAMPIHGGRWAA